MRTKGEVAPRISADPLIHHGAAVIKGTRVSVSIIIGSLAGGMSKEETMREYVLSKEDVEAALAYAAELVATIVPFDLRNPRT